MASRISAYGVGGGASDRGGEGDIVASSDRQAGDGDLAADLVADLEVGGFNSWAFRGEAYSAGEVDEAFMGERIACQGNNRAETLIEFRHGDGAAILTTYSTNLIFIGKSNSGGGDAYSCAEDEAKPTSSGGAGRRRETKHREAFLRGRKTRRTIYVSRLVKGGWGIKPLQ